MIFVEQIAMGKANFLADCDCYPLQQKELFCYERGKSAKSDENCPDFALVLRCILPAGRLLVVVFQS